METLRGLAPEASYVAIEPNGAEDVLEFNENPVGKSPGLANVLGSARLVPTESRELHASYIMAVNERHGSIKGMYLGNRDNDSLLKNCDKFLEADAEEVYLCRKEVKVMLRS